MASNRSRLHLNFKYTEKKKEEAIDYSPLGSRVAFLGQFCPPEPILGVGLPKYSLGHLWDAV